MHKIRLIAATSLLLLPALNAQTVYTNVAGYVKLGNTTPGQDAVAANKDVYLSIPLETALEFTGTVASTTATEITVSGSPGWTTGSPAQWEPDTIPYCAIITSGAEDGLRAVISTNTADTLTVSLASPGDLTNVLAGDSITIRKCWTLQSFFAGTGVNDGCQILLRDETQTDINQIASESYVYFGGDWYNNIGFALSNDIILHPGETFVLRSAPGAAVPDLTIFGDVSTSALRVSMDKDGAGDEDMFIASMSPIPAPVNVSNIPVVDGDQLLEYSSSSTGINQPASASYVYFGGFWYNNIGFADVTSTLKLEPGAGYILRRVSGAPASAEWTEPAP